jgi:hypothetical protein
VKSAVSKTTKSWSKRTQNRGKKTKLIEKNPKKFRFVLKLAPAGTYKKLTLENKGVTSIFDDFAHRNLRSFIIITLLFIKDLRQKPSPKFPKFSIFHS